MLTAIGWAVRLPLEDGRSLTGAAGASLLYDPKGRAWPKRSLLVAPIRKSREECDDEWARKFLGGKCKQGEATLPPTAISRWKLEGRATDILFTRHMDASRFGGSGTAPVEHPFGERVVAGITSGRNETKYPRVYSMSTSRGRLLRIDSRLLVVTERGIVAP